MKLLVVGGTGVISYAVVQESVRQGFDVTCINRGLSKMQILSPSVHCIIEDYRNKIGLKSKLQGNSYDVVIDFLCMTEEDVVHSVDIFGSICKQLIIISSCAVYDKGKGDIVCREDSALENRVWQYSMDKVKCEKKIKQLSNSISFNYTIVRPAVTYGNTRIPYGITPQYGYHGTMIQRMLHGKPIITWDGGNTYTTITHVDDFAIGIIGLCGNPKAYNETFNIVGDECVQWKDVLNIMAFHLNVEPVFFNLKKEEYAIEIPKRRGELLGGRGINQYVDNKKLKSVVPHFRTNITLKEGIGRTIRYYIDNNYLSGIDYRFDADCDRIIEKYQPDYHLHFIDYLGHNSIGERKTYYLEFYKENMFVHFFRKFKRN